MGLARGDLSGDPAAYAAPHKIKLCQLQGVENFKELKNNVLDDVDVLILVGLRAAGMRRRDHGCALGEPFMKRHPALFNAVHVGEASTKI